MLATIHPFSVFEHKLSFLYLSFRSVFTLVLFALELEIFLNLNFKIFEEKMIRKRTKVKFRKFQLFAIQVNEISKLLYDVLSCNPNLPTVGQDRDPRTENPALIDKNSVSGTLNKNQSIQVRPTMEPHTIATLE